MLDDPYFKSNPTRERATHRLREAASRWLTLRPRDYHKPLLKAWDDEDLWDRDGLGSRGIPVSLDIHRFDAGPAHTVLEEYVSIVQQARLPRFGIIFGKGDGVLESATRGYLSTLKNLVVEEHDGYCYCRYAAGDEDLWPSRNWSTPVRAPVAVTAALPAPVSSRERARTPHPAVPPPEVPVQVSMDIGRASPLFLRPVFITTATLAVAAAAAYLPDHVLRWQRVAVFDRIPFLLVAAALCGALTAAVYSKFETVAIRAGDSILYTRGGLFGGVALALVGLQVAGMAVCLAPPLVVAHIALKQGGWGWLLDAFVLGIVALLGLAVSGVAGRVLAWLATLVPRLATS